MKSSSKRKLERKTFVGLFGLANLLIVLFFYKQIILATVLLIVVLIIGCIIWRSHIPIWIFIVGALFGSVSEMIAIHKGVWEYTAPNLFNIPSWLIILWGNAALFIYHLAIEFERRGFHRR